MPPRRSRPKTLAEAFATNKAMRDKQVSAQAIGSPAGDSLWQVTGGGRPVSIPIPQDQRILGGYHILRDAMSIASPSRHAIHRQFGIREAPHLADSVDFGPDPRATLVHEAGHRRQRAQRGAPEKPFSPDLKSPTADSYYKTDRDEAYAQTFANAYQFIVDNAKATDKAAVWREMGRREKLTPGMEVHVRALLKEPLFTGHPLNELLRPVNPTMGQILRGLLSR